MKIFRVLPLIAALGSVVFAASAGTGLSSYQPARNSGQQHLFKAWPKGESAPLFFKSSLYVKESVSSVRIDESKLFPAKDDTPVRTTDDFDSLFVYSLTPFHSVSTPQGLAYVRDTVWIPTTVIGNLWVFKKVSGRLSLYTTHPGRGSYKAMDTGSGIMAYSENIVRRKIADNPQAAKLLRQEKIGHSVAWGMGIGGLGLFALGASANLVADGSPGNPFMLAGLGIAAISWIPHLMVQDRFEAAIKAYNADSTLASVPVSSR